MALAPLSGAINGSSIGSGAKAGAINGSGATVAPWRQSGAKESLLRARAMVAQRIAPALWCPTPAFSSVKSMQLSWVSQFSCLPEG